MRLFLFIVLVVGAGLTGWITGSLYPAPQSVLDPVERLLAGDQGSLEDTRPDTTPISEPEAAATSPAEAGNNESSAQYRAWISEARAAHPYPESEEKMFAVMMCESGGRADIINPAGPYSGLFQYSADTWNGDWNQYRDSDILDARAQVFATALAWNNNMQSHWGCYSRAH